MNWKKLGKIFDPTQHKLPNDCVEFAQSPQTLVLNDRVRVFFSTRKRDSTGKFLSHVAFADFSKDMKNLIGVAKEPVINLGELGAFDEHGIFPINVLSVQDKVYAYTTGWNRKVSVSVDAAIGFAISYNDGLTFQKHGAGPILASSLKEPFLVGDAFVKLISGKFHMWYIFGTDWIFSPKSQIPERVYKIAYASSDDGINWKRDSRPIIEEVIGAEECQALPTIIEEGGKYHMYFCYRHAFGFREDKTKGYRLGYAYSSNLRDWTRDDAMAGISVSPDGWDSEMQCYPHVFGCENKIYMLYNGNEFGKYGFGLAVLEGGI